MWKTFVVSPLVGALAAVLGWTGAILFEDSMTTAEFASLRFGWAGALIGGVSIACLVLMYLSSGTIEPLVTAVAAAAVTAALWSRHELPFQTDNLGTADGTYWFTVTMMVVTFLLLLTGLRVARESNHRARG